MSLMSLNLRLPEDGTTSAADDGMTDPATAASAIAELRRVLAAPGMLTHPAIRNELHKLDEQLAAELAGCGGFPGRHRYQAGEDDQAGKDDQADEGDHDDHDAARARGDRAAQAARPR